MKHSLKQIIAMLECPRKWAAENLFGICSAPGPQRQEGIDFHSACSELLLPYGILRRSYTQKVEAMARTATWYATPGMLPEHEQPFELFGRKLKARLDAVDPSTWVDYVDWKKSSGPQYELDEQGLRNDPQQNFQSYAMMQATGAIEARPRWVYVDKHPNKAGKHPVRVVSITIGYDECETWLLRNALPAMQLIELFANLHAHGHLQDLHDVAFDGAACKYEGKFCEHVLGHCRMQNNTRTVPLVQLRAAAKRELRTIVER